MKPRQIIENAAFGPDALKIVFEAFDEAWSSIEGNFGDDSATAEAARSRLANIVLTVARDGASDVASLKTAALSVMALEYKTRSK
jgi:hypothetical protein